MVIGLLGATLDNGVDARRWERWRPTVDLCRQDDLLIDRLELLHNQDDALAAFVAEDVRVLSPETEVRLHRLRWDDPWDFEEVYGSLHDFARHYNFDPSENDYLVHITTGTHVAQICLFLLTESRHLPGRLLQATPPRRWGRGVGGRTIIDLDLSAYDRLAGRFAAEHAEARDFLKQGIDTKSPLFNRLIARIEQVALASTAPLLLMGPTGAGKSQLAQQIYQLKHSRRQLAGELVEVNCATLRGDAAMSALFGHVRGAYTGAQRDRQGLLQSAGGGVLFLDEIGELGLDEQAMLLRAIETKRFLPVGADREVHADFQLIAGTNRDLYAAVREGRFREDLLARIDLWSFDLPGLAQRREDIEPNLDHQLSRHSQQHGTRLTMNRQARERFLVFAHSQEAQWPGNFRDFNGAIERMATLAHGGRINAEDVAEEVARLRLRWRRGAEADADQRSSDGERQLRRLLGEEGWRGLDRFDQVQLADVVTVCRQCHSLSEAGRVLFAASRQRKRSSNDADRLRKYLARHGLEWSQLF